MHDDEDGGMMTPPEDWIQHVDAPDEQEPDSGPADPPKRALRAITGRLPPSDVEAEAAVLAAVILRGSLGRVTSVLRASHFYSDEHRCLFDACLSLELAGEPIDVITVRNRLVAAERLQRAGGTTYLTQILDKAPALTDQHVLAHARIIRELAQVRAIINAAQRIEAEGYTRAAQDPAAFVQGSLEAFQLIGADEVKSAFPWESAEDIMALLPPIQWVCRDLCLGPGRPTLVAGYGYSGKTLALQSLAVAVAAGKYIWDHFFARTGRVLHIDFEQGGYATKRRYQRLCFAMGVTAEDLGDRLRIACFPDLYLTSAGIEDILVRECAGVSVCIIDSFRAAAPGLDENDSNCRQALDLLTRVSEKTGTCFLVIHHAGKTKEGGGDKRETARGSSAIFDACGTVLKLTAKAAFEPVEVELVKTSAAAEGKHAEAFCLAFEDVCDEEARDMKAGLKVAFRSPEQVNPPEAPSARIEALQHRIRRVLRTHPGSTGNAIATLVDGRRQDVFAALELLEQAGEARREKGGNRSQIWFPVTPSEDPE